MEKDLLEAKNYISQQGYGGGTNYTTNLVAVLLANYAQDKVKKLQQHSVMQGLPEYNEIFYHARTLDIDQFRDYWNSLGSQSVASGAVGKGVCGGRCYDWKECHERGCQKP